MKDPERCYNNILQRKCEIVLVKYEQFEENTLFFLQEPFLQELEAENCPKFKNMLRKVVEAEKRQGTFILDAAQDVP